MRYRSVWPGVDVRFHGSDGSMKYDVELAAGADHRSVLLGFEGLDGLFVDSDGDLVMHTSVGEVRELAPVSFYGDGAKEAVPCRFVVNNGRVSFAFPQGYDHGRPLVIDPVLIASTLSGAT
ncbi:MAG: hypothetical protein ACK6A5_02270, partial [Flavobacteriales bacterium]